MYTSYSDVNSVEWLVLRETYGPAEARRRMRLSWAKEWGMIGEPTPQPPETGRLLGTIGKKAITAAAAAIDRIGFKQPALQAGANET